MSVIVMMIIIIMGVIMMKVMMVLEEGILSVVSKVKNAHTG